MIGTIHWHEQRAGRSTICHVASCSQIPFAVLILLQKAFVSETCWLCRWVPVPEVIENVLSVWHGIRKTSPLWIVSKHLNVIFCHCNQSSRYAWWFQVFTTTVQKVYMWSFHLRGSHSFSFLKCDKTSRRQLLSMMFWADPSFVLTESLQKYFSSSMMLCFPRV